MKYANQISEMINAFMPEALKLEQMDKFYCSDTIAGQVINIVHQLRIF